MRFNRSIVAATAVGLLVGVPGAGAAAQHFITGNDVKDNSLTTKDVRNLSLHAKDFDKKVQKALKVRAKNGAVGQTGANGCQRCSGCDRSHRRYGCQGCQWHERCQWRCRCQG